MSRSLDPTKRGCALTDLHRGPNQSAQVSEWWSRQIIKVVWSYLSSHPTDSGQGTHPQSSPVKPTPSLPVQATPSLTETTSTARTPAQETAAVTTHTPVQETAAAANDQQKAVALPTKTVATPSPDSLWMKLQQEQTSKRGRRCWHSILVCMLLLAKTVACSSLSMVNHGRPPVCSAWT